MIMSVMHFDDLLVPDESVDEAVAAPVCGFDYNLLSGESFSYL